MEPDDLSLDALGLAAPDRPLPKHERQRVTKADVAPPKPTPALHPLTTMSDYGGRPVWVAKVRFWEPPQDLGGLPKPVPMAIDGLIQKAKVGALVSAGGTGKTTLLLTLGCSHATGRPFLGMRVEPGSFVLLSADDSQDDLDAALGMVVRALDLSPAEIDMVRKRLRVVSLQGEPGTRTFATISGGAVQPTGMVEFLIQALEGIDDLVGIGLDTMRQFAGGSSNDEEIVKATISGATEIAAATGAYVAISHHTGKNNFREGISDMYCGSGSAAIADNCRFVLLLQTATWPDIEAKVARTGQEQGDPLVLTSTRGSLRMKAPPPIFLHRDGYRLGRIAGASLSAAQIADEEDRAILAAVRAGAQSKNAIATAVRRKRDRVLRQVDDLLFRGLLTTGSQSGSGKLMVSGTGAAFLDAPR